MGTLPQIENLACVQCQNSIDILDLGPEAGEAVVEAFHSLCPTCAITQSPPNEQETVRSRFDAWRHERSMLGDPPGTLYVFEERIYGGEVAPKEVFSAKFFAIVVDNWDKSWPQIVLGETSPFVVILSALIQVDSKADIRVALRWSWTQPARDVATELHNALSLTTATSRQLLLALNAFKRFPETRGRTRDDKVERCRQFRTELPVAISRAREARALEGFPRHGSLSQEELAKAFGFHEDTLRARLSDCGLDWNNVRQRAGSKVAVSGPFK